MTATEDTPRERKVWSVVVAAGRGQRFGASDKAFQLLDGEPVVLHALTALSGSGLIDGMVLVAGPHTIERATELANTRPDLNIRRVVVGGATRQDSVTAGVRAVPEDVELVLIHDGARPLVTGELIRRCLDQAGPDHGVIAALPVSDTLKQVEGGNLIQTTVDRNQLWTAQTPQVFPRAKLVQARDSVAESSQFTDEAALFEVQGWPVMVVQGERTNLKITTPDDLLLAEAIIAARRSMSAGSRS